LTSINELSFGLIAVALVLIAGMLLRRRLRQPLGLALMAGLIIALVSFNLLLRTGDGTYTQSAEFESSLKQGKPVLVELYSNY